MEMEYDIICIGTGITALYMGYQMMSSNRSILFIEKDMRIGGRIHSIPLSSQNGYYAEGCAQRYYPSGSPLLINLMQSLGVNSIVVPNGNIKTGKEYQQLLKTLMSYIPPESKDLSLYSFPIALMNATGNPKNIDIFCASIGYALFKYPINLDMAYGLILALMQPTQNLIDDGFLSICTKLYDILKKRYPFIFDLTVQKISYDGLFYIINDKYKCRKIVATGTKDQLRTIDIQIPAINNIIGIIDHIYFDFMAIRIYLYIPNPWWSSAQLFSKYNTGGPLNQVVYYSGNTILIYSNMESANILLDKIPMDLKYRNMQWYNASMLRILIWYIVNTITNNTLYGNMSISMGSVSHVAFKYTRAAAQFMKPVSVSFYNSIFNSIRENNGFFIVGGDYTRDPGWVESCLSSVHTILPQLILNNI